MQHLFGSEIPLLAQHFRDYVAEKYQVELVIQENQNAQNNMVYDVFLPENSPHFDAIMAERESFLQAWLEQQNARAWQQGPRGIQAQSTACTSSHVNKASVFSHIQQQKITVIVTALCVVVYLLMLFGFAEPILLAAHFPEDSTQEGEIWRYLTHTLVHLSNMHILFNLTWWWVFGGAIERQLGSLKLLQIYLFAGVISGIAQNIVSGPAFFGLSDVVYAVLGYVFVLDKLNKQTHFELPEGFFNMLVVGILLGFAGPLIDIQIGNTAHISGLLVGMLLAFMDRKIRVKS